MMPDWVWSRRGTHQEVTGAIDRTRGLSLSGPVREAASPAGVATVKGDECKKIRADDHAMRTSTGSW